MLNMSNKELAYCFSETRGDWRFRRCRHLHSTCPLARASVPQYLRKMVNASTRSGIRYLIAYRKWQMLQYRELCFSTVVQLSQPRFVILPLETQACSPSSSKMVAQWDITGPWWQEMSLTLAVSPSYTTISHKTLLEAMCVPPSHHLLFWGIFPW